MGSVSASCLLLFAQHLRTPQHDSVELPQVETGPASLGTYDNSRTPPTGRRAHCGMRFCQGTYTCI